MKEYKMCRTCKNFRVFDSQKINCPKCERNIEVEDFEIMGDRFVKK